MKILRTYVATCLLLVCNAVFAQTFTVDNIKYEVSGGDEVIIVGVEDAPKGSLVLPDKVTFEGQEYIVTMIDGFSSYTELTHIQLPNNLVDILSGAFSGCVNLKQIELPESLETIHQSAFKGCTALRDVKFPNRMKIIWDYAFQNCTSLTEVVLPDSIDSGLKSYLFSGCTQLQSIILPSYFKTTSSTACNRQAFEGCSGLKRLIHRASEPLRAYQILSRNLIDGVSVIVPNGCLELYSADVDWNKWPLCEMEQYSLNCVTIPNKLDQLYSMLQVQTDFADHGLLTSPSQISTNKLEPTEGSIEALLDNDKETYFHSTWSVANESLDNYHFLEVDLGKAVKEFTLNFARRSHSTVSSPRVIHVYATNDPNGEWEDKGTYTCEHTYYCFVDELWAEVKFTSSMLGYSFNGSTTVVTMDDKYRYVRLEVEQSYASNAGEASDNNIYFTMSELAIFETFDGYKVDLSRFLTAEERALMFNDVAIITEASAVFGGTEQMVETLDAWIKRIQEGILSGVGQLNVTPAMAPQGVYSISGKLVKTQGDNLNDLPRGVYIVNGKKVVK